MFEDVRQDFARCGTTTRQRLEEVAFNPGMWAVLGYRFRRWVQFSNAPWPIRKFLNFTARFVDLFIRLTTTITLPASARIGPGLTIPHLGCIVVNSSAVIGSNCTLTQGVTIGHGGGGRSGKAGCPVLGNRVYVGPGAAIVGPIEVGHDALIGIGAVVTRSVSERAVMAGNPARLLSKYGSFDLISYPGMEEDSERLESLARRAEEERRSGSHSRVEGREAVH